MNFLVLHRGGISSITVILEGLATMYIGYLFYRQKRDGKPIPRSRLMGGLFILLLIAGAFMFGVLASHYGQP
jgi:hypothetical protein